MGWPQCNTTLEDMKLNETAIWHDYTFHELGVGLSAIFSAIAVAVSFFLIAMHAIHYSRPNEQRHIIRILLMVPIYAAVSFLSFVFYWHSVYFEVLRDCYEAFAIASFFSLLCSYIREDLHSQKQYFRMIQPKPWIWPMAWFQKCFGGERGCLRTPRSGLTWFNVVWVAVFQYCFIRVAMTIVALVAQVFKRYCLESLNPAFAHIWVMCIEALAVTVAMYCLIQFYVQIKEDIAQHKPLQKIIAIKLVIFLSFWQTIILSFLTSTGAIKPNNQIQTPDIKVGIPAMLLCIEMALFAIFHLFAFSWRPYVLRSKQFQNQLEADSKPTPERYEGGLKALVDAFNPWDLVKAIARSAKWLFRDRKNRTKDSSYLNATPLDSNIPHGAETINTSYIKTSTSYKPHVTPERLEEDRQTLLSASQPMAKNPSKPYQQDPSYYGQNKPEYYPASNIGVAQTTSDQSRRYMAPVLAPSRSSYDPYSGQTTGTVSVPAARYEASRPTDPRQPRAEK